MAATALRLTLLAHGATAATRRAAFPHDEPLEDRARQRAATLAGSISRVDRALTSPALRARQTAEALGLDAAIEELLRDCDYGCWAGQRLDDVAAAEPEAVAAWLSDPDFVGHGGEATAMLARRIAGWLDALLSISPAQRIVAVTHAAVARAAIVHVLGAPLSAFWRIDIAPLGRTELVGDRGRWTLHAVTRGRFGRCPERAAPHQRVGTGLSPR